MSTLSATNRSREKVLGYPVDIVDQDKALSIVEAAWQNQSRLQIVTLNAEMVVAAQQDNELDRIIRHAHLIIADGAGVVWALRLSGLKIERLPGIELAHALLARAAQGKRRVALIGGREEVVARLASHLPEIHNGLQVVAYHHGYFGKDTEDEVVDEIAGFDPELVLVALGVPKQEYFIDRWAEAFPHAVMVGVGGSFDVWGGEIKRAPALMRKLSLEWLYRLVTEPWRLKRMGQALPNFGFQVVQDLLKGRPSGKRGPGEPPHK
jgi:N-acetylglucosaminyldiphosphoundecaprenol N-acetyl-beta-D-mannosaminyltransferase